MNDYTATPTFSEILAAPDDQWRALARRAEADLAYCQQARERRKAQAEADDKPKPKRRRRPSSRAPGKRDRITLPRGDVGRAMAEAVGRVNGSDEDDRPEMTRQQKWSVEIIRREVIKNDGHGSDDYEYKQFSVEDAGFGGVLSVVTKVGRKNDEGTAALVCRVWRHFFIGPRGGIKLVNPAKYVSDGRGGLKKKPLKTPVRGRQALWALAYC